MRYIRQIVGIVVSVNNVWYRRISDNDALTLVFVEKVKNTTTCLLYTSDAADDLLCVDLGCRRINKKKKNKHWIDTQ